MNFLQTLWAPVLPPNFLVRRAHIDWPQEEEICHCELLLESTEELKEWPELKYQWSRSSKSSLTFTIIEGEEGQVCLLNFLFFLVSENFWVKVNFFDVFPGFHPKIF